MIKFPRMHLAQSAVNRILNVADELGQQDQGIDPIAPPAVPDATAQGAALDQALQATPPPITPPAGAEGAMTEAALTDDSPMNAAVEAGIGNDGLII